VHEKEREQRPLVSPADLELAIVLTSLERPQDQEPQHVPTLPRGETPDKDIYRSSTEVRPARATLDATVARSGPTEDRRNEMRLLLSISVMIVIAAVLLAPAALADPPSRPHDYYALTHARAVSSVPPDLRDHRLVAQLIAGNARSAPSSSDAFVWSDFGIGTGAGVGAALVALGLSVVVRGSRRRRSAAVA
jgi:hypothetical protein